MGLSAPKKRSKLSHDPNNTSWSKSTTGFGHKIMSKQGWKPGDYLGAENASHSDHYTAANASHIRVLLREDNLGLGAQVGKSNAETFGLSLFAGVLGRLNGKSDGEVTKQQNDLRDAELRSYQAQKYGFMNFVRGGLLVGDKMEPYKSLTGSEGAHDGPSKKRKLENVESQAEDTKKSKKSRKSDSAPEADDGEPSGKDSGYTGEKARRKRSDEISQMDTVASSDLPAESTTAVKRKRSKAGKESSLADKRSAKEDKKISKEAKALLKAEKKARKEERRRRKEEKRKVRRKAQSTDSDSSESEEPERPKRTPASVTFDGGRHAVRQRYIQQKRMASMNAQAMKEIFMLKASA